jgi:hypothetical protein
MLSNECLRPDLCEARRALPIASKGNSIPTEEKINYLTADYLEERAAAKSRDAEQLRLVKRGNTPSRTLRSYGLNRNARDRACVWVHPDEDK